MDIVEIWIAIEQGRIYEVLSVELHQSELKSVL